MNKWTLKVSTYVSMLFLALFIGLYSYAWIFDPDLHSLPFEISIGNVHLTVTKSWGGNLVLFNQEAPYTGGIYAMAGDKTVTAKGWDGLGIYFRFIKDTKMVGSWWTFMVSLWYPVIIFAILPLTFAVKKWRATGKLPAGRPTPNGD